MAKRYGRVTAIKESGALRPNPDAMKMVLQYFGYPTTPIQVPVGIVVLGVLGPTAKDEDEEVRKV
jgi:hypothetical protein